MEHGPASFEEAIRKTGFGKYNITLMLFTLFGIFSPMFETTNMSYIFASAQCDLQLSLQDKGYLNSMVYAGMISSAFIWGVLLDILGRKKLMICGYLLDATFVILSGLSQSFTMLLVCKYIGGFIIGGPFSAMAAYLSEFHSSNYRSRIQVVSGTFTGIAQIVLPLLAWGIIPLRIKWSFFDGAIAIHSWNVFLLVTGLCPLIGALVFCFLPESPKFLMTLGENEKALSVLRTVYSKNTGSSPDTYPVKTLVQEKKMESNSDPSSTLKALSGKMSNILPLFQFPYVFNFILIATIQIAFMTSLNILRLWTPQLFQAVEDYKTQNNESTSDLCTMIEVLQPTSSQDICTTNVTNSFAYVNSMIVASFGVCCYILTGSIINILGKRKVLIIFAGIGATTCFSLIFASGSLATTILISLYTSCGNVCVNIILSVVVDVFPTTLRAFSLSLVMALARIGVVLGNIIFPVLLEQGCVPPFLVVGGILACGGILSFFLPDTENRALV